MLSKARVCIFDKVRRINLFTLVCAEIKMQEGKFHKKHAFFFFFDRFAFTLHMENSRIHCAFPGICICSYFLLNSPTQEGFSQRKAFQGVLHINFDPEASSWHASIFQRWHIYSPDTWAPWTQCYVLQIAGMNSSRCNAANLVGLHRVVFDLFNLAMFSSLFQKHTGERKENSRLPH